MSEQSDRPTSSELPESDELLRLIVDSARDFAIITEDPQGLVTSWNIGAQRLLGYSEAEIIGRSGDIFFPPEDGGAAAAEAERLTARRDGRAEDERWQMRKDGTRFWASGLLMKLKDPNLGFAKILRDRTAQHRAEMELRQNEERFRLLATNIPQLVFRGRPDGDRTWGSPQWVDFTGLSLEESVGFGWLDAIHPDDRKITVDAWRTAMAEGEYYLEHRIRRAADGEYRWHQTRARPINGESDDWVGTMTDVHDLRDLQDRQQVLMAELQHRTRNLLAVTQAIASKTLRRSDSLEAFGAEFESRLRALSRVQSLLARVDRQEVDLRDLVLAELNAHDGGGESSRVRLSGPSVLLPANSAQAIDLALHELATNAVKYGALAQPTGALDVAWRVQGDGPKSTVVLEWKESGVAMPNTDRPRRKGYGTELIERALPYQLGADTRLEFGADGVRCAITAPVASTGT